MGRFAMFMPRILSPAPAALWDLPFISVMFGPEAFEGDSAQIARTRKFYSTCYCEPYALYIKNGDRKGGRKVQCAEVLINDKLVVGSSEFSRNFSDHRVYIDLKVLNELKIHIKDTAHTG